MFRAGTGKKLNRKIVNFTYSCLYARPIKVGLNPVGLFRAGCWTPLLQSSEILNLGLTAQTGNFWLTPWSLHMLSDSHLKGCLHTFVDHGISTVNYQWIIKKCSNTFVLMCHSQYLTKVLSHAVDLLKILHQWWITSA